MYSVLVIPFECALGKKCCILEQDFGLGETETGWDWVRLGETV